MRSYPPARAPGSQRAVEQPSTGGHWSPPKTVSRGQRQGSSGSSVAKSALPTQVMQGQGLKSWGGKSPWRRAWQTHSSILARKMPWTGRLKGYSPWGRKESDQFSSVQSCPTPCDPMNRSTPGLPVHHQPLEFTQTHVHQVGEAIQPSHPLSSPSPPAPNPSQHQGLFQ